MTRADRFHTDRRGFFVQTGAATAALAAAANVARPAKGGPTVVIVRDRSRKSVSGSTVDAAIVRRLVDKAVMDLSGTDDIAAAWKTYVNPGEKVAVKFNGLFRNATTHPAVITAVTDGIVKAGVDPARITVYDRHDKDFKTARITINRDGKGVRLYGTENAYGPAVTAGPVATKISKILLEADALINISFLKSHSKCGISGALKNHLGSVPNAGKFHDECCKAVADLNTLAPIKTKTRICLTDALYGVYDGGPRYSPRRRWDYHGILAATDPVALDTVLDDIIRAKRVEKGLTPRNNSTAYIGRAAALGLGEGDRAKINRTTVEI